MKNKITIRNGQFTLYYLLMASDGIVCDNEKRFFIEIINTYGGFTKSYCESLFNAMHKFANTLNYNNAIETVNEASIDDKKKTIELLNKLSDVDKINEKPELEFIVKVKKDLGLE